MTGFTRVMVIGVFALTLAGIGYFVWAVTTKKEVLPVMGDAGHVAGAFAFHNQAGQLITEKEVANKITVAEYFFTTCPGICKVMNGNLVEVYRRYKDNKNFSILSHTVDPETDSVAVLAAYASRMQAVAPAWQFLTGAKEDLYYAARQDYLLAVEDTVLAGSKEDFIHTEYVALLDRQRRIRGFYDATNKKSIEKLIVDIALLLKE